MRKNRVSNRVFSEGEITNILYDLDELIHSESFNRDIYHDIYDLVSESKYFDVSEIIHDLSDLELKDITKDYVDEREVTYNYLDSLSDGELNDLVSEYNPLYNNINVNGLADEYRYKLCIALFNKNTSSFELEKILGDDLVRELRYLII